MSRKRCPGCGEVKDFAEFSRAKRAKDGLQCWCKSCNRRYREENREAEIEYYRRRREEHREVLNEIERRRRKKINDALREVATRNGEPWTPAEDAYILSADEPVAVKAMELGRTISSVHYRSAKLRKKTAA